MPVSLLAERALALRLLATRTGCRMHDLLDQILEAGSQWEAQSRLEEVSGELEEEAGSALEVLEEGIFDATAAEALPEKYRERP